MTQTRVLAAAAFALCLGATSAFTRVLDPEITGVAPSPASPSQAPQVITVNGHGFIDRVTLSITTPGGTVLHTRDADVTDVRDASFRASVVLAAAGNYQLV